MVSILLLLYSKHIYGPIAPRMQDATPIDKVWFKLIDNRSIIPNKLILHLTSSVRNAITIDRILLVADIRRIPVEPKVPVPGSFMGPSDWNSNTPIYLTVLNHVSKYIIQMHM